MEGDRSMTIWYSEKKEEARVPPSQTRSITVQNEQFMQLSIIKNIVFKDHNRSLVDWGDFIDLMWDHRSAIIALLRGEK